MAAACSRCRRALSRAFALLAAFVLAGLVFCSARLADSAFAQAAGVLAIGWRDGSAAGLIYGALLGLTVAGMGLLPLAGAIPLAGLAALPGRRRADRGSAAPGGVACWLLCAAATASGWTAGLAWSTPQPSPYDSRGPFFAVLTGAMLLLVASAAACAVWGALAAGRWSRLYRALLHAPPVRPPSH